jgi:hypothetical protein
MSVIIEGLMGPLIERGWLGVGMGGSLLGAGVCAVQCGFGRAFAALLLA